MTLLLVILAVNLLVLSPLARMGAVLDALNTVSIFLVLVVALLIVPEGLPRLALGALLLLSVAGRAAMHFLDLPWLVPAGLAARSAFYVYFLAILFRHVSRHGPVTPHRVRQAIALYLLVAVFFGALYALVESLYPGSFQVAAWWQRDNPEWKDAFHYFSMVTITTVGYGDFTAVHPLARSLVMIEALIGQLYPAILIARLVTMELQDRESRPNPGDRKKS